MEIYAHLHGYVSIDLIDFGGSLIWGNEERFRACTDVYSSFVSCDMYEV